MTRRVSAGAVGIGCALGALLAGCTSSGSGATGSPSPSVPSLSVPVTPSSSVPLTPTSAPPTSAPPPSVPPTSSSAASSSSVPSAPPTTAEPTAPRSTCTKITIRVIRGSAAPGFEFAALQFVNAGSVRCVLNGYPTVTLRRGGKQLGAASQPASNKTSTYTLAPGATAESDLRDYSNCQAPLSDEIAVVAPGSSISAVRPGQLRGCVLRVFALAAPQ